MKKAIIILTGIILSGIAFEGCKKGEGDPGISFKSRKSRMTGEWKLTAGEVTNTNVSGSNTTTTHVIYDGSNAVSTLTVNGSSSSPSTNGYTLSWAIVKDGSYKKVEVTGTTNATTTTTTGTWNFLNGVGDLKNKEAVEFFVATVVSVTGSTSTSSTYTGSDMPHDTYLLNELKSKEVIFKSAYTHADSNSSDSRDESWTLTQ